MADPEENDRPVPDDKDASSRPTHSLWDVMRHEDDGDSKPDPDTADALDGSEPIDTLPDVSGDDIEFAEAPPEEDFDGTSNLTDDSVGELADPTGEAVGHDSDLEMPDAEPVDEAETCESEALGEYPGLSVLPATELPAFPTAGNDRKRREPAVLALVFGIAAAALSLLCLLPLTALRIIPGIAGLASLTYGCLSLAKRRSRSSGWQVLFTGMGLSLGLVGLFAGPLWLNEAGERWRHEQTSRIVMANLQQIGTALDSFHSQHQRFPAGGSFADSADGLPVGMHGWMTDLLPHLGYEQLSGQIDHFRPWSDPANASAMQTRVEIFLTPGTPYELTATGHAPTHFAGVGGRVETDFGTGDLGIFGRNSQVTRDDVIDGLSQTMVAGEITQSIPAWGEPDNWRPIGAGLNKSPQGFGNANNTGAHFLMADGSVRFLSNRTSLQTLQQLSTRNGSEPESR